jgi:hypothetical protein
MRSDQEVCEALEPLLFGWYHQGLRACGRAFPFGGFLLVASTVDVLAGLAYNPLDDDDRNRGSRYRRFVQDFFPPQYTNLRNVLWESLRSEPLHYLTTTDLLFADGQPEHELHLTHDVEGRVILHWPEFFTDYEFARDRYWEQLRSNGSLMDNARQRLERRPIITVDLIRRPPGWTPRLGVALPSVPTAMNGPLASGALRPKQ